MRHTLDRIAGKPTDYKICCGDGEQMCDALNWYENESCVECHTENNFRPTTEEEVKYLCEDVADGYIEYPDDTDVDWSKITVEVA